MATFLPGTLLFTIHYRDLELHIKYLLNKLAEKKTPLWKQVKVLEAISTHIAEEMILSGMEICNDTKRIIWAENLITKQKPLKKGETVGPYGIFSKIVEEWGSTGAKKKFIVPKKKIPAALGAPKEPAVAAEAPAMEGNAEQDMDIDDDVAQGGVQDLPERHVGLPSKASKSKWCLHFHFVGKCCLYRVQIFHEHEYTF